MRFLSSAVASLLVAATAVAASSNPPTSIRLAFNGPTGMSIGYNTATPLASAPTVLIGTNATALTAATAAVLDVRSYGTSQYNYVKLTGLQPYTRYYYQIQHDSNDVGGSNTATQSFMTARTPGDMTPYSVNVVGDLGLINGAPTADAMTMNFNGTGAPQANAYSTPDYLVHVGDIAYADNCLEVNGLKSDYESCYDQYTGVLVAALMQTAPYMVLPGNHEVEGPTLLNQSFIPYRARWDMPQATSVTPTASHNMWYSFESGMVHWVILDTETDLNDGGATAYDGLNLNFATLYKTAQQQAWLAQDLASVNRALTPWVIACVHRPFYTSREHGATAWTLAQFEPLFTQWGVDLHLAGHNHFYERMLPVRQGQASPKGYSNLQMTDPPVYVVIGGAGNVENHYSMTPHAYTQFFDSNYYGYGQIDFLNSTCLHWMWHRTTATQSTANTVAVVESNTVVDDLYLCRDHSAYPLPAGGNPVIHNPSVAAWSANPATAATIAPSATGVACAAATNVTKVCYTGYSYSADFAIAPQQLVVDTNYDQTATNQNNAIITINAWTDAATGNKQGNMTLSYLLQTATTLTDTTAAFPAGTTMTLQTGAPTAIKLVGTVYSLVFAAPAVVGATDPLAMKCNGGYPVTVSVSFDTVVLSSKATTASLRTIKYTCATSSAGYWGQGYFDYTTVSYGAMVPATAAPAAAAPATAASAAPAAATMISVVAAVAVGVAATLL